MVRDDRNPEEHGPQESEQPEPADEDSGTHQPQRIVEIAIVDGILLKTGAVRHQHGPSGEYIGVTEEGTKNIDVGVRPGGPVESTVRTLARPGEVGTLETCRILIRRLRAEGANWSDPVDVTARSDDVDCEARDGNRLLRIQVVRARDGRFWGKLARSGEVVERAHADEAIDALRSAIRDKETIPPAQRPALVLALDAVDTPAQVLRVVVEAFRARHGRDIQALGFAEIWVVGPTPDLCYRLDL